MRLYDDITNDYIETIIGVGPSMRVVRGDLGTDKQFINDRIHTLNRTIWGYQATFQLYYRNFYAKAYYGVYNQFNDIPGLTGGQFYLSIGISAEIGATKELTKSLEELLNQ